MRTMARMMMVAGVVALCGSSAFAQRGGGGQPGGFGGFGQPGGFGGFGGGFGATVNLRTGLFTNKALQEELKISEDQLAKFKAFTDKQTEAMKPFMPPAPPAGAGGAGGPGGFGGGLGGFGGAPVVQRDDEEQLKFLKVQVTMLEERISVTKSTLSADQLKRLSQLENQQLAVGGSAFTNARVVKALGISEEQTAKIKELNDEMAKESREMMMEMFSGGGRPDMEKMQEMQKKMRSMREETTEKIEKTLSADQRTKWKDMTGESFDFNKLIPQRPMRDQ